MLYFSSVSWFFFLMAWKKKVNMSVVIKHLILWRWNVRAAFLGWNAVLGSRCIHALHVDAYMGNQVGTTSDQSSSARLGAVVGPLALVCYEKDESQTIKTDEGCPVQLLLIVFIALNCWVFYFVLLKLDYFQPLLTCSFTSEFFAFVISALKLVSFGLCSTVFHLTYQHTDSWLQPETFPQQSFRVTQKKQNWEGSIFNCFPVLRLNSFNLN